MLTGCSSGWLGAASLLPGISVLRPEQHSRGRPLVVGWQGPLGEAGGSEVEAQGQQHLETIGFGERSGRENESGRVYHLRISQ